MADEIKKVPEEVKKNIENAQEGAISDDAAEAVAGGDWNTTPHSGSVTEHHAGVHGNTNRDRR